MSAGRNLECAYFCDVPRGATPCSTCGALVVKLPPAAHALVERLADDQRITAATAALDLILAALPDELPVCLPGADSGRTLCGRKMPASGLLWTDGLLPSIAVLCQDCYDKSEETETPT